MTATARRLPALPATYAACAAVGRGTPGAPCPFATCEHHVPLPATLPREHDPEVIGYTCLEALLASGKGRSNGHADAEGVPRGLTLLALATVLGVTRERARQIEERLLKKLAKRPGLRRLRDLLAEDPAPSPVRDHAGPVHAVDPGPARPLRLDWGTAADTYGSAASAPLLTTVSTTSTPPTQEDPVSDSPTDVPAPETAPAETPAADAPAAFSPASRCTKCNTREIAGNRSNTRPGTETWCALCRKRASDAASKAAKARTSTPTPDASAPDAAPADTAVGPELTAALGRWDGLDAWLVATLAPLADKAARFDDLAAHFTDANPPAARR